MNTGVTHPTNTPTPASPPCRRQDSTGIAGGEGCRRGRQMGGDSTGPLPDHVEATLAWSLREAVTNVVRHSAATSCRIRIGDDGRGAHLEVGDNGRGAPAQRAESGLRTLRERVNAAGGSMRPATKPCAASSCAYASGWAVPSHDPHPRDSRRRSTHVPRSDPDPTRQVPRHRRRRRSRDRTRCHRSRRAAPARRPRARHRDARRRWAEHCRPAP
jgi:hypothetical protein